MYYGRNGWCDGQDVKPLVYDITKALLPQLPSVTNKYRRDEGGEGEEGGEGGEAEGGTVNTLHYHALSYDVGGANPSEKGCGGTIRMSTALLFYQ